MVDIPKQEEEQKSTKKKRGRPKGSTKKKNSKNTIDTTHLKILIKTISDIIASKPGMSMWALSMDEIEQIEKPLAKVLERHAKVGEIAGEYGDYVSLIIVAATIFLPKYLMWKAQQDQKKAGEQKDEYRIQSVRNESGTSKTSTSTNANKPNRKTTTANSNIGGKLYDLVPTIL